MADVYWPALFAALALYGFSIWQVSTWKIWRE